MLQKISYSQISNDVMKFLRPLIYVCGCILMSGSNDDGKSVSSRRSNIKGPLPIATTKYIITYSNVNTKIYLKEK